MFIGGGGGGAGTGVLVGGATTCVVGVGVGGTGTGVFVGAAVGVLGSVVAVDWTAVGEAWAVAVGVADAVGVAELTEVRCPHPDRKAANNAINNIFVNSVDLPPIHCVRQARSTLI